MQIFHDAYFDFKGDVLEILEQRHDWAKFTFTQELFRYVFMDFIPELIVHSKNQDEEQSVITTTSTHGLNVHRFLGLRMIYTSGVVLSPDTFESLETLQGNKLAIVCNKLDLKPTDRLLLRLGHPRGLRRQNLRCYPRQEPGKIWHGEDSSERFPPTSTAAYTHILRPLSPFHSSVHRARTLRMTLTWDTGGRVMKWAINRL
ncbi:hypothetical protein B0H14DRAFT_2615659 [Mycena olivaceomarginata]|nr:hypothetical protein B0H14DRAFT_2615659 [Mycena olivaceomarginata]